MRLTYLFAALLAALAVALSLLLVPRDKELALQTFRDRDYELAREVYLARYQKGERGADTLMPLTGLSLDMGDVAEAVRYLEEYVARNPEQLESREMLGGLYRSDGRMADYLANLEEIVRRRATYEMIYELASYYRFFGRFEQLVEALRKLAAIRPDDTEAVTELAELLAARGDTAEAAAVLTAFDDHVDGRSTPLQARALLTALLVRTGGAEAAFARADRWLHEASPTVEIIDTINQLVEAGRADLAYRLLRPYEGRAAADQGLTLALADLEINLGRLEEARLRLSARAARGPADDASLGRFIGLATTAGLSQLALDSVRDRDLRLVPDWVLTGLAQTAFTTADRPFLDRIVKELGDEFFTDRPVLAGEIALARDDKAAARRWAAAALADPATPVVDHLTAVRQLLRAGAPDLAAAGFDGLQLSGALPDQALIDLGSLFIELQRSEAGLRWFAARRREQPTPAADLGWARLATRAGQAGAVSAWLENAPQLEGWILQDIAAAATQRGDAALALAAAERAYALGRAPDAATVLAGAYLLNDRAEEALALVRPLLKIGGPAVEFVYVGALQALGLLEELADFWTAKLATGLLTEAEADGVLYAMVADKSWKAALPYLKQRAESRGGEWLFAYAEAARGLGGDAVSGFADFLDRDVGRADLDDAAREQRLFLLMEASRERAAVTLARLTEGEPARWWAMAADNLRQAGRRDELADLLETLIPRADVGGADREAMAYALIDAAGIERALPVTARLADEFGGAWDALHRENLTKLGRREALRSYLTARALRPDLSVEDRRALVFGLLELGDKPAAETVLTALAAGQAPDGEDMAQLYYLWGPRPGPTALAWLEGRARGAPTTAAKAAWYVKMVELGAGARVLTALSRAEKAGGDAPPEDAALLRPYIEAKAAARDDKATARAVQAAAKVEKSPETLRRYARLAEQLRRNDAASAAWSALAALRPDDSDALRQLGMLAYDDLRYNDAERLLRRYLRRDPDDYEAYYFMGEALTLLKRQGEATSFHRTALAQLRARPNLPQQAMQTEAGLLNRLGRVDEAIVVYEKLRRLRPADRQIQADYAGMLIENRRLPEARNVLSAH